MTVATKTSSTPPTGNGPANPEGEPNQPNPAKRKLRKGLLIATFLGPALIFLGALVIYPIIFTLIRSFYGVNEAEFVGFANYVNMFTSQSTFTAIRNNVMWVIVAPVTVTVLGLIFAVLMEKLSWSGAFKLIIFMPMAISMLAAGVIFRSMFQENPNQGVVNAVIAGFDSAFSRASEYPGASPRPDTGIEDTAGTIASTQEIAVGSVQNFPLTGIRAASLPEHAEQAVEAPVAADEITGTVFSDVVSGGGGTDGVIEPGKNGLPGMRVQAVDPDGQVAASALTEADGTYTLTGLDPGVSYRIALPASNFAQGFQGVSWLGPSLINAVIILSYVWIWAGFAMVMISSGMSAIDRSLLEASRVDGANEWQVFTRITIPLLAPVLMVVLITLIINVLKIFDLVYVIPPGQSKPAANVIAVEMWTVSFGGGNNQGLGSALAILLLILVLPAMLVNIRRFRQEGR